MEAGPFSPNSASMFMAGSSQTTIRRKVGMQLAYLWTSGEAVLVTGLLWSFIACCWNTSKVVEKHCMGPVD